MARVTIEDCIEEIDNAFDICTLASKRAKDLSSGAESYIDSKNKPSVLALKEIAEKKIGLEYFEVSNKQIADSKLFNGVNEEEIVEELTQQMSENTSESNVTSAAITSNTDLPISGSTVAESESPVAITSSITESPVTEETITATSDFSDDSSNLSGINEKVDSSVSLSEESESEPINTEDSETQEK
tara:strand:- start:5481 stop:6041 length:561 start_codon:yes stop_codon:yes gene_type:complete